MPKALDEILKPFIDENGNLACPVKVYNQHWESGCWFEVIENKKKSNGGYFGFFSTGEETFYYGDCKDWELYK